MLAIIGGSGLNDFQKDCIVEEEVKTDYGIVRVKKMEHDTLPFLFLPRHGAGHKLPPHRINYRANVKALSILGATDVIATQAIGGIGEDCGPGNFIVPDQVIDYTWGRDSTFYDNFDEGIEHIDFTYPFSDHLRDLLIASAKHRGVGLVESGCYACTQGPRLETAAEVRKYQRDGSNVVGMTVMPEAALARELQLNYASLCFSVNWAAGLHGLVSLEEIMDTMHQCSADLQAILNFALESYKKA